jgi:feruloyl-CoA synthase
MFRKDSSMPSAVASKSPSEIEFLDVAVCVERRSDFAVILRTKTAFVASDDLVHNYLRYWAEMQPNQLFLAERHAGVEGWRRLSYGQAYDLAVRLASALATRRLSADRPILILSGNSIEHQIMGLAAMIAGVPYTPLSVAYSTMSGDLGKLRKILQVLDPGLVFAAEAKPFLRALAIDEMRGREIVIGHGHEALVGAVSLANLLATSPDSSVITRARSLPSRTIAKILFTSGSTGVPKGVPTTHRMMCTSMEQIETMWPFMARNKPVLLDWLPWSHVFGGSYSMNTVLKYGGALYIDDGRPMPGEIARTLRNLREVRPTLYWNVPKGYEAMLPLLRSDASARSNFFGDLMLMFYAGASLPAPLWQQLVELGREVSGRNIPMTTSWGLTETAPSITMINSHALAPGNIGIPMPGLELKLIPHQGKLEARVRGPNVMDGYWKADDASSAAFDEEGFFRTGDALEFADKDDAARGLIFNGRIAEDFKLLTGTWVDAASVRLRTLKVLADLATDLVVTGADRDGVGVLLVGAKGHDPGDPHYRARISAALSKLNEGATGASQRVMRAIILRQPPSFDLGEITEKGSLNARLIRERRQDVVEALYDDCHPDTIKIP